MKKVIITNNNVIDIWNGINIFQGILILSTPTFHKVKLPVLIVNHLTQANPQTDTGSIKVAKPENITNSLKFKNLLSKSLYADTILKNINNPTIVRNPK